MEAITNNVGEMCIETSLKRTTEGLLVNVKAHPKVEEFMQRISGGEQINVSTVGRQWLTEYSNPQSGARHVIREVPLRAYALHGPFDPFRTNDGSWVDMDRLGGPLISQTDGSLTRSGMSEEQLNFSFIRLVGISEPEGASFLVRTVLSTGALRKLRDSIHNAQNTFISDYIKTVEYCVTTASQRI